MKLGLGIGLTSQLIVNQGGLPDYSINGFTPPLVGDFLNNVYAKNGSACGFSDLFDYSCAGSSTYVDSDGVLQTASADVPRLGNHVYDGAAWVNKGLLHESESATNSLLNSDTLSTQNVTVTAEAHTLHFTGTGTITLSGAATDGPLVGTGTGENNRVSLTFTPTAGTLTVTVSGTVTNAQLELGSIPTSYIPTAGSVVTRPAQTLEIAAANMPAYTDAVSIHMKGLMNYADNGDSVECLYYVWQASSTNYLRSSLSTVASRTGRINFAQRESVSGLELIEGAVDDYSPGLNIPFNIAARHGSTFINGALDGVALTEDTTPTALADMSAQVFQTAATFNGNLEQLSIFPVDIGDAGIEEATT